MLAGLAGLAAEVHTVVAAPVECMLQRGLPTHRLGVVRPCVWHHYGGHASETKLRLPFFLPPLGFVHAGGVSLL